MAITESHRIVPCPTYSSLPPHEPLATIDPFTTSIVLPFPECVIVEIIHYVAFSYWHLSLSNVHLSFLHAICVICFILYLKRGRISQSTQLISNAIYLPFRSKKCQPDLPSLPKISLFSLRSNPAPADVPLGSSPPLSHEDGLYLVLDALFLGLPTPACVQRQRTVVKGLVLNSVMLNLTCMAFCSAGVFVRGDRLRDSEVLPCHSRPAGTGGGGAEAQPCPHSSSGACSLESPNFPTSER